MCGACRRVTVGIEARTRLFNEGRCAACGGGLELQKERYERLARGHLQAIDENVRILEEKFARAKEHRENCRIAVDVAPTSEDACKRLHLLMYGYGARDPASATGGADCHHDPGDEDQAAVPAATANMDTLLKTAGIADARIIRRRDWDDCGRDAVLIGFQVVRGDRRTPVLMPDVPAARWVHERCYIDGNSWMWKYAPGMLRKAFGC